MKLRPIKAKKPCKKGDLVGPDDVEVVNLKDCILGIDYGTGKDYTAYYIRGGNSCGRTAHAVAMAKTLKATVIVRNLRDLDAFVQLGLQPSQIRLPSEFSTPAQSRYLTTDDIQEHWEKTKAGGHVPPTIATFYEPSKKGD